MRRLLVRTLQRTPKIAPSLLPRFKVPAHIEKNHRSLRMLSSSATTHNEKDHLKEASFNQPQETDSSLDDKSSHVNKSNVSFSRLSSHWAVAKYFEFHRGKSSKDAKQKEQEYLEVHREWNQKSGGDKTHSFAESLWPFYLAVATLFIPIAYSHSQSKKRKAQQLKDIMQGFESDSIMLNTERTLLLEEAADIRHNITIYSGISSTTREEFSDWKNTYENICVRNRHLQDVEDIFYEKTVKNGSNTNIESEHKKFSNRQAFEEMIMLAAYQLTRASMETFFNRGNGTNFLEDAILDTQDIAGFCLTILTDYYTPEAPLHNFYKSFADEGFYKDFFSEAIDANLLILTDNNKHEEAEKFIRLMTVHSDSFDKIVFPLDVIDNSSKTDEKITIETPDYLMTRAASYFMRCQANDYHTPYVWEGNQLIEGMPAKTAQERYKRSRDIAEKLLLKSLEKNPNNVQSLNLLAVLHFRDAEIAKRNGGINTQQELLYTAIGYQDRAADLAGKSNSMIYRLNRSRMHIEMGDLRKAEIDVRRAIEEDGKSSPAHLALADVLHKQGKYVEAREALDYVEMIRYKTKDELEECNYIIEAERHEIIARVLADGRRIEDKERAKYHYEMAEAYDHISGITTASGKTRLQAEVDASQARQKPLNPEDFKRGQENSQRGGWCSIM